MIAAYLRVSTTDQRPDMQREEIDAWAKAHRMRRIAWYEDTFTGREEWKLFLNE